MTNKCLSLRNHWIELFNANSLMIPNTFITDVCSMMKLFAKISRFNPTTSKLICTVFKNSVLAARKTQNFTVTNVT